MKDFEVKPSAFKSLWPLLHTWDDPKIGVQLGRFIVLYEDLRIEWRGATVPAIEALDENTMEYRQLYFLRRAYATLIEVAGALHALNKSKEFRLFMDRAREADRERWDGAIRFFNENRAKLKHKRNLVGAHFTDETAAHALSRITPYLKFRMEYRLDHRRRAYEPAFTFAYHLARFGFASDRGEMDSDTYAIEVNKLADAGFHRAADAFKALYNRHFAPHFGARVGS